MKIEFDSNDNLPLNKPLKFPTMSIVVRSVCEQDGKFYPQIYFDECLHELKKCYNTKKFMFQKEWT